MPTQASVFRPLSKFLQTLATIALVVFVLYAARSVIIPVALAVMGTFVLAPITAMIERVGLKRVPAALVTLLLAGLAVAGMGWLVMSQVTDLAHELPKHRDDIRAKVDQLRGGGGPFSSVVEMVKDVTEGGKAAKQAGEEGKPPEETKTYTVTPVENSSPLTRLGESAVAVAAPLADAALVLVLVAFMLIGREDLRDRVLGVVGRGRLLGATRVLTDSASKVSQYLLYQSLVNAGFGTVLAVGLFFIGVPYAPLWGLLSGLMRFVPYVGTWVSFLFPFALSFATSSGWVQPVEVFVYFALVDTVVGNVVEPLLFGHHTGVSPIALLVAAAFWTWIWGPVGLLLSTPITVCLVVIGQHVPRLRPLALLLGSRQALPPAVQFYQRLLSNSVGPAADVLRAAVASDGGAVVAFDAVVLPALTMTSRDRAAGRLTVEEESSVFEGTAAVLAAMATDAAKPAEAAPAAAAPALPVVVGVPAHRSAEGLPLKMLALALDGVRIEEATSKMLPAQVEALVADSRATVAVVSVIPPGGLPQAIFHVKNLRKKFPALEIVVSYFGAPADYDRLLERLRAAGANHVTTTVGQTCTQVRAALAPADKAAA